MGAASGGAAATGSLYRALLSGPAATALLLASLPARLGGAMTGLGLVWLIHAATGSFARAGAVTGTFAVAAAVAGPFVGRLHDRHGQRRVLPVVLAGFAGALALVLAATAARAPLAVLAAGGALLGACAPQVSALTAARWSHLLAAEGRGREGLLPTAFALDALTTEASFLVGPALVGTLAVTVGPLAAMLLAGGLVLSGCLVLLVQPASTPPARARADVPDRSGSGRAPATTSLLRRLRPMLVLNAALGAFFGATQVSVTAFAVDLGQEAAAGPLYSLLAVGSVTAGIVHGHRHWRWAPRRQLDVVLPLLALASVPLLVAPSVPVMGAALVLAGLFVTPTLILGSVLTQQTAPASSLTQAFTWLGSAAASALAAGASLAGYLVDGHGSRSGFAVSLGAVLVAVVLVTGRARAR